MHINIFLHFKLTVLVLCVWIYISFLAISIVFGQLRKISWCIWYKNYGFRSFSGYFLVLMSMKLTFYIEPFLSNYWKTVYKLKDIYWRQCFPDSILGTSNVCIVCFFGYHMEFSFSILFGFQKSGVPRLWTLDVCC